MQHVMIDLETLGTTPDSIILSIGACRFDLDSDKIDDAAFYTSIAPAEQQKLGRTFSDDTLVWWMQQPAEARAVFGEPKESLQSALTDLADWFAVTGAKFIWSNGASFDIPMLNHAYKGFDLESPWEFYDERCLRTFKTLPGMKDLKVPNALKHNALQDAIAQAKLAQAIQARLTSWTPTHPMVKVK